MTRPKFRPTEELTPFARYLRENYLWRDKNLPQMTVPQFADVSGISRQAIWSWFKSDTIPRRSTIIQLAERTGLDVDELLRAADLPDTTADAARRRLAERVWRVVMHEVENAVRNDSRLTPDIQESMIQFYGSFGPQLIENALNEAESEASDWETPTPGVLITSKKRDQTTH